MPVNHSNASEFESSFNIQTLLLFIIAMVVGLLVAIVLLPTWLPNLSFSLGSEEPKAYWYLSRATALVSLSLLWISMALGLGITNKMVRLWRSSRLCHTRVRQFAGTSVRHVSRHRDPG